MKVDLKTGMNGIVTFGDGRKFFCLDINQDKETGEFSVRIESGVRFRYTRWGRRIGGARKEQDIVEFIPMSWGDPRSKGLPTEVTP